MEHARTTSRARPVPLIATRARACRVVGAYAYAGGTCTHARTCGTQVRRRRVQRSGAVLELRVGLRRVREEDRGRQRGPALHDARWRLVRLQRARRVQAARL